jgi:photosystem II stability/assembly factor-like uncharacterized protein
LVNKKNFEHIAVSICKYYLNNMKLSASVLLSFLFIFSFLNSGNVSSVLARDKNEIFENQETGEEILQREQFIYERRAGGPGKIIPPGAYQRALYQKSLLPEDRNVQGSPTAAINWVSVNPIGLFYLRTNNNYISGRTNSIAFHPSNPNIIYIGAAQGGVWKTTDGGLNWTALTDNLSTLACGDVVVDQSNPDILYLGTGELNYSGDSQYGDGIFKSTNAGATWFQVATVSYGSRFSQLAIDPSNSNVVYAAGNLGVYKTTNGGTNWENTSSGSNANCVIIDPTNTQVVFITTGGTSSGVVRKSTNGGTTWFTLSGGLPGPSGRIQLAISNSSHNVIYASIAQSGGALRGLYRTTDGGDNWTLQNSTTNYLGSQGWYDNAVVVHPSNPDYVIVGGLDIYASTDAGVTLTIKSQWATTNPSLFSHADIHALRFNGSVLYCCSDGGVYKSPDNANSWSDLNQTLSTLQYQSADYDVTNVNNIHGGTQDNNKEYSTNGGANWVQRTTGDGGYTIIDPVNPAYIYGQYVNGSCQRSANFGVSYTEIKPSGSTGGLFYNPYEMAPGDHNTIVFGRADLWKTTNAQTASSSSGWIQIATTGLITGNVSAIGISWQNTDKIYIGTSNGRIHVTSDNGSNWISITGYPYVSDFAVDDNNDNICYATLGGTGAIHVLKTIDGGLNWTNITGGLPSIAANSVILRTAPPRMLFVGTDLGVYQSTNEGANWVSFNSGLPLVEVYDMKYKQSAGILLAATHGRGCWTFDIGAIIGVNTLAGVPKEFSLSQNYPNPFNPSTTIKFDIPKSSFVNITIYNELGEKAASVVNKQMQAGKYETRWNASNYPSGVYFYKLTAGNFTETKKMVIIK